MSNERENQTASGSSRIAQILNGYELHPPMSRVEALLYALLNGSGGGGMSVDEIRAYIDEQMANAEGLSNDTLESIRFIEEWLDENGDELSSLLDRVTQLEDSGPYAKVKHVTELPKASNADPNTLYIIQLGVNYIQMMYHDGRWLYIGDVSGGGGGTSDYDSLINTPIKNIKGSSISNFVNLAGLSVGQYILTGYYKEDSSSELVNTANQMHLIVMTDAITNEKVLMYDTVNNHERKQHILIYDGGRLTDHIIKTPGKVELFWEE